MKCNNCGNEIEDGVGFCRFCGSSTVAPSQPTMERPAGGEYSAVGMEVGGATYQKMPTKKKKNLKWLIPVIAIVVVLGVLAGIFVPKLIKGKKHGSPKKVVEAFVDAMKDNDMDKIIDCYHPSQRDEMRGTTDESGIAGSMAILQMFSFSVGDEDHLSEKEVAEFNKENGTSFDAICLVDIEMSYMGMSESNPTYTVKDDGKWYLINIDLYEVEDDYDYDEDDWEFED